MSGVACGVDGEGLMGVLGFCGATRGGSSSSESEDRDEGRGAMESILSSSGSSADDDVDWTGAKIPMCAWLGVVSCGISGSGVSLAMSQDGSAGDG